MDNYCQKCGSIELRWINCDCLCRAGTSGCMLCGGSGGWWKCVDCAWTDRKPDGFCWDTSPDFPHYNCTLAKGHRGNHVADVCSVPIAEW